MKRNHWAILIDNSSYKQHFVNVLLNGKPPSELSVFKKLKGLLFSKLALERFMDEEERHGTKIIHPDRKQALRTMSSGEQKKALLRHILKSRPDYIILDNPFDNLDSESQETLKTQLEAIAHSVLLLQLASRKTDVLAFIEKSAFLKGDTLLFDAKEPASLSTESLAGFKQSIPSPLVIDDYHLETLIALKNVCVSYLEKPVLNNINWTIKKGSFWELRGKNGSGKTTILSMITGENPKAYGQDLYLFGYQKGNGESVWDIKKRIGYFTPSMTDTFTGYHSVEHMVISGFNDSIGLYLSPTAAQLRLAKQWLQLIHMWSLKDRLYHELSMGQKRLIMCVRAMIKHPTLLIFDEPTAGLDDASAALFVKLVNKFASESTSAIIFVSHRREPGLSPENIYQLNLGENGSTGACLRA